MLRQYAKIQKELKLHPAIGVYGNQIANGAQHLQEKVNRICLIKQFIYIYELFFRVTQFPVANLTSFFGVSTASDKLKPKRHIHTFGERLQICVFKIHE
jgi:hypothetical protein